MLGAMLMAGCEDSTFQNSVPAYPVHVVIDTRMGDFVHFQREIVGDYVIVTPSGYFHKDKLVQPLLATDRCGYGGVIVYVNMLQDYCAFDLACPNCAQKSLCRPFSLTVCTAFVPSAANNTTSVQEQLLPNAG